MAPTPLVAGNWKMNGTQSALAELKAIRDRVAAGAAGRADVAVCPPFTLVGAAAEAARGVIAVGGQDCHSAPSGAHTGDISAEMPADLGAAYVILGHSERRQNHGETNEGVRAKAQGAWRAGLAVIPLRIEPVEPGERLHYHIADAIPLDAVQPPLSDHLRHLTAIVGRMLDGGEGAPLRPLTLPPQPLPRTRRPLPSWLPIALAGAVGVAAIALVATFGIG